MRVLFVGLGGIGQRHLRLLSEILGDELEAHAVRTRGLNDVLSSSLTVVPGENLETKYRLALHRSLDEGLNAAPEVVFVTNPTSMHYAAAHAALERGIPVFIEKPIAVFADEARDLRDLAIRNETRNMVGFQMRFHPCFSAVSNLIRENRLGRILSARFQVAEYMPNWHRYEDYRGMYASRRDLGGGVIRTQIHEIDMIFALFGMPETVYTVGGKLSDLEIDVEDVAHSILRFGSGETRVPVVLSQDYLQAPPRRSFEIVGTSGKVEVDLVAHSMCHYSSTGELERKLAFPDFQRDQLFRDQLHCLLRYLAGGAHPPVSLVEGCGSMDIADACLSSLDSGAVVGIS